MSVINQMLNDLQARQGGVVATEEVRAVPGQVKGRSNLPWLLAGGVLAISAVAFAPMPGQQTAAKQVAEEAAATPSAQASTAAATAAAAVAAEAAVAPAPAAAQAAAPAAAPASAQAPVQPSPLPAAQAPAQLPAPVAAAANPAPSSAASLPAPVVALPPTPAALPPLAAVARVEKAAAAQSPAQRAQGHYRQGVELANSGHASAAMEKLAEALKQDPSLQAARVGLAALLLEQGRSAEAANLAQEGLSGSAAGDPQLTYLLARAMAERGDAEQAIAQLDQGRNLGPDALGLRAGLRSQQGDFARAQTDYEAAVRGAPGNSLWWLGLGVSLESQGRQKEALLAYGRARALGLPRPDLADFIEQKLEAGMR